MTRARDMPTGPVGVVTSFADGILLPTGAVGADVLFANGGHMPTGTVGIDLGLPTAIICRRCQLGRRLSSRYAYGARRHIFNRRHFR